MHADAGEPVDLEAELANITAPVTLVFFTQTFGCETCLPARQVVDRVASLSRDLPAGMMAQEDATWSLVVGTDVP